LLTPEDETIRELQQLAKETDNQYIASTLTKEHRVDSEITSSSIQLPISCKLHLSMTAVCPHIDT